MFSLIERVIVEHSFAMILVYVLLIMLTNEKSMEKARNPSIKRLLIIAIILYYFSIVVKVVFSIIQRT
jgi:uncharacterized membrane protein (DUF485 family)